MLRCGVSIFDYWELTLGEMLSIIEAYKANIEYNQQRDYSMACMISSFVNMQLTGKQPPAYEKLYGTKPAAQQNDAATMFYMDQWKDFAERRNKMLKESKNNDSR